ncbi:MAG: DUF937 domain-containing protein [Bauldia sp.]|nr:DUF937 domain-containing protein [Bauldia sp.]MCW5717641.1 DUF937 domain-containing protein [Bauldia sp.]MCW5929977.1 DUF937 domain-containing protein [Chitinophagaceae bacterium]
MDMLDVIARSHGGRGVQVLGAKFGLTERQTRAAIDQLAPAVMAGIRRQLQSGPDGVAGVVKAIATGNHGRYLDRDDDGIVDDGNAILGHVFKSKDVSRGVADRAATASGVSADVLRKMLPVVTAMVMGGLSQQLMGAEVTASPAVARPNRRGSTGRASQSTQSRTAQPAPAASAPRVTTSRSTGSKATSSVRPAAIPTPPPGRVASRSAQPVQAPPVRAGAAPQQPTQAAAPDAGGLGGLLGQLLGGGQGTGAAAAGGGGLGGLLGQLVGGGSAGGAAAGGGGGGIGDLLQGILGGNAQPEARAQATQSIGDLLSGLLGGGTPRGNDADRLLDAVTRPRTGR